MRFCFCFITDCEQLLSLSLVAFTFVYPTSFILDDKIANTIFLSFHFHKHHILVFSKYKTPKAKNKGQKFGGKVNCRKIA